MTTIIGLLRCSFQPHHTVATRDLICGMVHALEASDGTIANAGRVERRTLQLDG